MKESIKTVFKCDFCNRNMFVKNACIKHEDRCTKNPKNWPKCSGCMYLVEYKKEFETDDHIFGYREREAKAFKCTKLDIGVYPKKAERLAISYPETFENEILMPSECDHFETERFEFPW